MEQKERAVLEAKEKAKMREDLAKKYGAENNPYIQQYLQVQQLKDFRAATRSRQERIREDFQNFYLPSDDLYSDATGDDDYSRPRLYDLERLAMARIGVADAIARRPAEDAFRNWISWKEIDSDKDVKNELTREILKWQLRVDFYNKFAQAGWIDRWAGIAFIVKYWPKSKDRAFSNGGYERGQKRIDYSVPPPKGVKPNKLQVFDPLRMTPTNITDTNLLNYDEEVWTFRGGLFGAVSEIHRDRVHVVRTLPLSYDWRGMSRFEPIWLSLMAYFNAIIYNVKHLSKWGNQVAKYKSSLEYPTTAEINKIIDLVDEFRANYVWICGLNEDIEFAETKMSTGLNEFIEFLKEDISASSEIPIPYLFGRAVSAGISGAGIVVSERYYMNTVAKYQHQLDDDIIRFHESVGFDLGYLRPNWNLSIQKTKEQEYVEESMRLQNEILEEQLKQIRADTKLKKLQLELMKKYGLPENKNEPEEILGSESSGEKLALPNKTKEREKERKEDFAGTINFNFYKIDKDIPFRPRRVGDIYDRM